MIAQTLNAAFVISRVNYMFSACCGAEEKINGRNELLYFRFTILALVAKAYLFHYT
jgi:hypothetical protein